VKNTIKTIAPCALFVWAQAAFSQNVLTLSLSALPEGADAQAVQAQWVLPGRDFARMGEIVGKLQTLTVTSHG